MAATTRTTTRQEGRACHGRAKGAKLQVQCAVSSDLGLVHYRLQWGSIRMDVNADFVNEIHDKVKASPIFQEHFQGKKIVVDLDNAPAHNQTEERIEEHDDLVFLRLAPYSPMCNPIEGKQRIVFIVVLLH
ncbi:hypothetical protein PI125_g16161 [Phytophthora idaei]|nr:hypothetical protein PI125_g16161 [Phytophthora idaei]KAG3142443.1 hypothetical protein PI126_g15043 [Phytophthora idaei]